MVTLATSFIYAGFALLVTPGPASGSAGWLKDLVVGAFGVDFVPKAILLMIVIVAVTTMSGTLVSTIEPAILRP